MMEIGRVVSVQDDKAVIITQRNKMCDKCGACEIVGRDDTMRLYAMNDCNAQPGDNVAIELSVNGFLSAALLMYGVPLVALMIGMGLGAFAAKALSLPFNEIISFVVGFLLMIVVYKIISMNEQRFNKRKYQPVVVAVVGNDYSDNEDMFS